MASSQAKEINESGSALSQASNYITGSIEEFKKVSTPTKQETMQATLVTLIIVGFVSISLFFMDVIFGRVVAALLPGGTN